jgi:hypothetical protein
LALSGTGWNSLVVISVVPGNYTDKAWISYENKEDFMERLSAMYSSMKSIMHEIREYFSREFNTLEPVI